MWNKYVTRRIKSLSTFVLYIAKNDQTSVREKGEWQRKNNRIYI